MLRGDEGRKEKLAPNLNIIIVFFSFTRLCHEMNIFGKVLKMPELGIDSFFRTDSPIVGLLSPIIDGSHGLMVRQSIVR
jgi:hypothetical protein